MRREVDARGLASTSRSTGASTMRPHAVAVAAGRERARRGLGHLRRDLAARRGARPARGGLHRMTARRRDDGARRGGRPRGTPLARPNPWVGAVVVGPRGAVVASGATEPVGERHAEVVALDAAGADARGATLYVTLEPCAHQGRTPPCTDRVLASGVARVVVAVIDPDERVAGRGIAALRDAGVQVDVGTGADEVASDLAPYLHHRTTGRPLVVLKWAATLDGRTAAADGSSRWITSPSRRATDAHRAASRQRRRRSWARARCVATTPRSRSASRASSASPCAWCSATRRATARLHPCLESPGRPRRDARGPRRARRPPASRRGRRRRRPRLPRRGPRRPRRGLRRTGVPRRATTAHRSSRALAHRRSTVLARGRFVSVTRVGEDLRVEVAP